VQIHRVRSLSADDVTEHAGLRVTTPARTLLDLADVLDPAALDQAIERALILRRFNANEVRAVLARANGRRGAKRLREAVGGVLDASPKARSIPGAILIVELDGRTTHTTPHARARRLHRRPRDRAPTRR
jgi:hypothetical protein